MSLLLIVALATLSLSSVEVRQASQSRYQLEAQANARMALMIALGELQKYAGPDQRVTAAADIHEGTNQQKKHLLGVWNTKDWDPKNPSQRELLTWLATVPVADTQNPTLLDMESVLSAYSVTGSELITAVGDGTLGEDSDEDEDHVKIATVPVHDANGDLSGTYGYWVSDESTKANFAIPTAEAPLAWDEASKLGSAPRTGLEVLDETVFADYETMMKTSSGAKHAPSYQTFDAMFPSSDKYSGKYFHALTNGTYSLMTNTRHGGLKSDLSTAFELDLADFNALGEFHNSGEKNRTDNYDSFNATTYNKAEFYPSEHELGYLFEIDYPGATGLTAGIMRGPTWDLLRNHYRIYKKDWEGENWSRGFNPSDDDAFAARGTLPLSYASNRNDDPSATVAASTSADPFARRSSPGAIYGNSLFGNGAAYPHITGAHNAGTPTVNETNRAAAARVAPMVTRLTYVLGLKKVPKNSSSTDLTEWRIGITVDPYVTLVNPYNRPIEFESIGVYSTKMRPLIFFYEYTKTDNTPSEEGPYYFSKNWGTDGSFAFRLPLGQGSAPGGLYRLEPGEVKVMSPQTDSPTDYENNLLATNQINVIDASLSFNDNSGLYIIPCGNGGGLKTITPKENTSVTLKICGRYPNMAYGKKAGDKVIVTQHYGKNHAGVSTDLSTHLPPPGAFQVNFDAFDDPVITELCYSTFDMEVTGKGNVSDHDLYASITLPESAIPGEPAVVGKTIAALDIRMKHGMEGAPVFHQFNPRGQVYDPRNYDGSNRLGAAWDVRFEAMGSINGLNLVDADNRGGWGDAYGANGQSKVVLFDLPRVPATSLASLSQADSSLLPSAGANTIANSFPSPALPVLTEVIGQRTNASPINPKGAAAAPQPQADFSWASNEALWDQYFYSSMNWGTTQLAYDDQTTQTYADQQAAVDTLTGTLQESPLTNPRMRYMSSFSSKDLTAKQNELKDYAQISKHLAVLGGFNVNSTSEEAWRAVLSGLRNSRIERLDNSGNLVEEDTNVAFSRFQLPASDEDGDTEELPGYRNLSDDEVTELAKAIVKQVKARGPFMGMADFVNRRLSSAEVDGIEVGKLGALQSAIENTSINDLLRNDVTAANVENKSIKVGGAKTITLSTMTGAPGYLMQADVLNSIGSILRTRSDTFVVRAYGDARDASGRIMAKSWCEARIQRFPEWIEPTDEPFKQPNSTYPDFELAPIGQRWMDNPLFPQINRDFGRRMKIVSFRWLAADEV